VLAVSLVQSGVKDNVEAGAEFINCFSYLSIQIQLIPTLIVSLSS